MNKKLFFGLVLLSFFSVIACNEQFNVGKNIIPVDDLAKVNMTDTVKVLMYTDSITRITSQMPSYLMLGKYVDPVFGTSEASFMTQVMQIDYPTWNSSAILDSICLAVPLAEDYYYGDNESNPDINVYELSDTLNGAVYYSNANPDDYTDYVSLGSGIVHKFVSTDTIDSVPVKGMELRLDDDFGYRLINQSDYYFSSYGHFYDIFKGIYVKCNNSPGIFKLRTDIPESSQNFGLIVYYHLSTNTEEHLKFVLPITSSSVRFNLFNHDFSGTPFESEITSNSPAPSNYVYLQAMAGTRVKLTFPGLKNFDKSLIINKAELILNEAPASVIGSYSPCETVWLDGLNVDKQVVYLQDYNSSTYFGFDKNNSKFDINITRLVQNYINNVYSDGGIDIYLDLINSKSDFKRTVLTNGVNVENPPKLVITYSKIN